MARPDTNTSMSRTPTRFDVDAREKPTSKELNEYFYEEDDKAGVSNGPVELIESREQEEERIKPPPAPTLFRKSSKKKKKRKRRRKKKKKKKRGEQRPKYILSCQQDVIVIMVWLFSVSPWLWDDDQLRRQGHRQLQETGNALNHLVYMMGRMPGAVSGGG